MARKETFKIPGIKRKRVEDEDNSFIRDAVETSIRLRSKDTEFYGLQRELSSIQKFMLQEFNNSADVKHPRDVGFARENIIKEFLLGSGLLPRKYGVSRTSTRVICTSGHYSKELDVVLYDEKENIVLMRRNNAIEYYPTETTFGTIQVKSKLTTSEISNAFQNISSYKKLYRNTRNFAGIISGGRIPTTKGFGIIFAYGSDLDWDKLHLDITKNAQIYSSKEWPNAICILSKGIFLFGDGKASYYHNHDLEGLSQVNVHGHPDRDQSCLFNLYNIMLDILQNTSTLPLYINQYYNLPQVAGDMSYEFALGLFTGTAKCPKHGEFLRKISEANLSKMFEYCQTQEPINWIKATDIALGRGMDEERYKKQPGDVLIYNPENHPWKELLFSDQGTLTYDMINTQGIQMWIPYYYQVTDHLIDGCPKCRRELASKAKRSINTQP